MFEEMRWTLGSILGITISIFSFVVGSLFTNIDMFTLVIYSIWPILFLLYPDYFRWEVIRMYSYKPAYVTTVLTVGWVGVIGNLLNVLLNV